MPKEFTMSLLFRGSENAFDPAVFHEKCDDQGPTLTIIKSGKGKVFGGYTDIPWGIIEGGNFAEGDNNTFVFSLRPNSKFVKL